MRSRSSFYGILCALSAYVLFPAHDALVKWLVADYSVWQIMSLRSAMIVVVLLGLQGWPIVQRAAGSPMLRFLLMRAALLVSAWTCFYSAARELGLGELTTIYFASPILVAVLAIFLLNESVSPLKWLAIATGFAGVLIACRPDLSGSSTPVFLALTAAVLWAFAVILVRKTSISESTSVNLLVANLGFVLLGGAMLPWVWITPSPLDALLFVMCAAVAGGAQYLVFEAIRFVPASTIAPLGFSSLIWAFGLGYLIWGDIPNMMVTGGAILIAVSGGAICALEWRNSATGRSSAT